MAKIEFKGADEYTKKLRMMGARIQGTIKYASYEAAGIVADAIKANTPKDTGDLRDSIALTKYRTENGFTYTKVIFDGYDRNGVPNALKANAIESGTSRIPKKPFIRPAVQRVKRVAEKSIETALNKKLEEMMK